MPLTNVEQISGQKSRDYNLFIIIDFFPMGLCTCSPKITPGKWALNFFWIHVLAALQSILRLSLFSSDSFFSWCPACLNVTWRPSRFNTAFCNSVLHDSDLNLQFISEAVTNRIFALMVMHARKPLKRISDGYDMASEFRCFGLQTRTYLWRSPIQFFFNLILWNI